MALALLAGCSTEAEPCDNPEQLAGEPCEPYAP